MAILAKNKENMREITLKITVGYQRSAKKKKKRKSYLTSIRQAHINHLASRERSKKIDWLQNWGNVILLGNVGAIIPMGSVFENWIVNMHINVRTVGPKSRAC
jgi:hypothetical protein